MATVPGTDISTSPPRTSMTCMKVPEPRTCATCTAVCRPNRSTDLHSVWRPGASRRGIPVMEIIPATTDLTPLTTWSLRTITASGLPALVDAALG